MVARRLGLDPVANWKFAKQDLAAVWFGESEYRRLAPPWCAADVAHYTEAELFSINAGSMCAVAMRDGVAPPGSWTASRTKCHLRNPGGPTGSIGWSPMGASRKREPECGAELRSGVGPAHSTDEAAEGNEAVEGRGRLEGHPSELSEVRTQSRAASV